MVTMTGGTVTTLRNNPLRISVRNIPTATVTANVGFFYDDVDPSTPLPGTPAGAAFLNMQSGDVFRLGVNMQWVKIGNVKGPVGPQGVITDATIEALKLITTNSILEELGNDDLPAIPDFAAIFADAVD